jgi:uncharacterized membrane protein
MDTGKSALGLDGNVAAALGYPIGIIAIISLIIEKENRFVRFHAMQSLLLHVAWIVVAIVLMFLFFILAIFGIAASAAAGEAGGAAAGIFSMLIGLIWMVVIAGYIGGLIYAAVKAYGGNKLMLPVVGSMADKWTGGS